MARREVDRAGLEERRRSYFGAVLHAARLKSMAALAKKLDVSQSALTNIQNGNRSAGPVLIEKIKRLAPGVEGSAWLAAEAIEILAEESAGQPLSIGQRIVEDYVGRVARLQGIEEASDVNIDRIRRNFDAMGKGDVFIYLSATARPLEMHPEITVLKKSIANAIQRQAFFLYLRPTQTYLRNVHNFDDIPAEFAVFKNEVLSSISNEESGQEEYRQRLLLIETDRNPLFALPDFKWELFLSDTFDTPYKAAAGALITSGSGLTPRREGPKTQVPLSAATTRRMLFEVARTVYIENEGLPFHDRVPVELVTHLKESAELAAGEAIDSG
jgi:transcriptional regulator with XRE-family HTH domain